ncbi:phosphoethanolamine transferase [Escherichia coli]|jgi:glucan phosphoethanolaminetransferase (alkaline phosphatase superfamily)|uniref:phosphoethanolamine transferase n=1 Tax=Escherichia coli TaxID=562 RepID=UPI0002B9E5AB|nr:phosphoethanolamine transferase [Escherichia coli]EFW7028998.1 phosphoethanolamine transferase [Shigella sonnei]HDQ6461411.1 phosphoethanolamine transferase [Escherichia coli O18 str. F10018-41]ARJ94641.1 phosphate starvation-inducible protein PsiE [Escherichia coli]AUO39884.1 phosphoethanolamine transferase [Escherichia coli]AXE69491.1 phosphoethanolamine transferase [Escherichia coli]
MTVFNKFARSFKSHWLLYLCVIVFGITNLVASSGAHMVQRLLFFVLTILVVKRISSLPLRLLVAAPFVLLTAADMSISLYSWCTFGTTFNDGFAISVLQSDPDEVVKMLGMYIPYLCAFAFLSLLFLAVIIKYDVSLPTKKVTGILLLIVISGSLFSACQFAYKDAKNKKAFSPYILASRFATYTPFFNLNYFALAAKEHQRLLSIANTVPYFQLLVRDTGIDTYVLIVGESVRVDNMSLYGYTRSTTPQVEAQRKQIKLFNQAISGAPYTALSVPLSLTADSVLSHDIHNYPDNIINMANQAGFQTFWLSSQSAFRQNGTAVTSIAMRAMETVYVRGFDELLLPHLSQALQQNTQQKKLIVLHLNGSHEPACSAYPQSSAVFQPQDDQDACYDNSIHYTDSLLGQVFELLKDRRASVMYFADHGLERDPTKKNVYFHGGREASQQAYHVPMFIWYSPVLGDGVDRTTENNIFSTAYNNYLINAWMGVTKPEQPQTLEKVIAHYKGDSRVVDANHDVFDYVMLRKEFTEDKQGNPTPEGQG